MNQTVESLGRIKLQGIVLLVVIFLVGGLAGAMVARARFARELRPPMDMADRRPDGPGPMGVPGFFRELDLTRDQREQIRLIFERHRPRIDSLVSETMPRIRALRDSAEVEIRAVLTPDQLEKYDRLRPPARDFGDDPPFRRPFREGRRGPR